jgi:tetratricopeptide (TPR) repeat protein
MKPFWITFYSYKGGVGRSLALANVAALLVKRGRNVVLIDFDLEAPGLDSFDEFASVVGKPGVVEYVTEFHRTQKAPALEKFVHACTLSTPLPGKLWIMPAGCKNETYNRDRTAIDWVGLYDSGVGAPFVENWKAAIAKHCRPDYVLVDSRTGLTDVGGICTLHLPDLLVMVFGLNEQNVKGIAAVAKAIRDAQPQRIPQIHYVASPVPNIPSERRGLLNKRLEAAGQELGVEVKTLLRYYSPAALHEELFVLKEEPAPPPLVRDYDHLLDSLIEFNRQGIDFLSAQVNDAISSSDSVKLERLESVLRADFSDRPDGLFLMSKLKLAVGDRPAAESLALRAFELDPAHEDSFDWLHNYYRGAKQFDGILSICEKALSFTSRLPQRRIADLHHERGCAAMAAKQYPVAVESFAYCLEDVKKTAAREGTEPTPSQLLIHGFNLAEASRRAGLPFKNGIWEELVKLFEITAETLNAPLPLQANRLQAIHIALAMVGNITKARDCLLKSRSAAELLGTIEDIFSVATYTWATQPAFLATNAEMLAALDRGELWDGTKLSETSTSRPKQAGA